MAPAVAALFGVQRAGDDRSWLTTLIDALRPREVLLLLDNCEHLVEACAELADRADACVPPCPGLGDQPGGPQVSR